MDEVLKKYGSIERVMKTLRILKASDFATEEEIAMLSELESEILDSGLMLGHNDVEQIDFDYTKLAIIQNIRKNIDIRSKQIREDNKPLYKLNLPKECERALLRHADIYYLGELKSITPEKLEELKGKTHPIVFSGIMKILASYNIIFQSKDELTLDEENSSDNLTLVKELNLSGRSANSLINAGITNLEELSSFTYEELKSLKGLGNQSFEEVMDMLHEHGIVLKDSGQKERDGLRKKRDELKIAFDEAVKHAEECKKLLDTYNELLNGGKTNTGDETPDFKDE